MELKLIHYVERTRKLIADRIIELQKELRKLDEVLKHAEDTAICKEQGKESPGTAQKIA